MPPITMQPLNMYRTNQGAILEELYRTNQGAILEEPNKSGGNSRRAMGMAAEQIRTNQGAILEERWAWRLPHPMQQTLGAPHPWHVNGLDIGG